MVVAALVERGDSGSDARKRVAAGGGDIDIATGVTCTIWTGIGAWAAMIVGGVVVIRRA